LGEDNREIRLRRRSICEADILNALYKIGDGTALAIFRELDGAWRLETVRTTLRVLEAKGFVSHRIGADHRNVYSPVISPAKAWRTAARQLADIYFGGSLERAGLAILKASRARIPDDEFDKLEKRVAASEAVVKPKRTAAQ
jgi:predicted transcriptional regulator